MIGIMCSLCLGGLYAESAELYVFIQNLEHARPPLVQSGAIVFSYETKRTTYIVAARFSHENYERLHVFGKNDHGVFYLALPLPANTLIVKYRLMVDGIWMSDPSNPRRETDSRGMPLSVFHYEKTFDLPLESPILIGDNRVEFNVQIPPGSFVTIAGDFNAYDPFSHRLSEISPGHYQTRLKLFPGTHYYYFVVDGVPVIDPRNLRTMVSASGQQLSVVEVK